MSASVSGPGASPPTARYAVRVDCFSGALGDLPKKLHGDSDAVLDVLRRDGRFTEWDVSTKRLAYTLDDLKRRGRIRYSEPQPAYPWNRVEVIDV